MHTGPLWRAFSAFDHGLGLCGAYETICYAVECYAVLFYTTSCQAILYAVAFNAFTANVRAEIFSGDQQCLVVQYCTTKHYTVQQYSSEIIRSCANFLKIFSTENNTLIIY
jgi:hypothetical protein